MKSTKTVEIEICDLCHEEKSHWPQLCSSCGKDLCDQCTERFSVEVAHHGKARKLGDGMKSYGYERKHLDYKAIYCTDCATGIAAKLKASGLIEKEIKNGYAVLD